MCTLSFIPTDTGYILTHNRDEHALRESALVPSLYSRGDVQLIYPKDGRAGGTWIASDGITTACLLNGAFEKHKHQPPYRKSRGLVLLESFEYDFSQFGTSYDFEGIEPFTLLIARGIEPPMEIRWDGNKVQEFTRERKPMLLSSSTLYSHENQAERELLFNEFINRHPKPSSASLFTFHGLKHRGNREQDFIMERESGVKTLSISQVVLSTQQLHFIYSDKLNHSMHWLKLQS